MRNEFQSSLRFRGQDLCFLRKHMDSLLGCYHIEVQSIDYALDHVALRHLSIANFVFIT